MEKRIINYLIDHAFKPHLKGFTYLLTGLQFLMENEDAHLPIGQVYTYISKRFNQTTYSIERCIRTSIENAWRNNGDYRPTNAEFIAHAALELRMGEEDMQFKQS